MSIIRYAFAEGIENVVSILLENMRKTLRYKSIEAGSIDYFSVRF